MSRDACSTRRAEIFIGELAKGLTVSLACQIAGLSRRTVYAWRQLDDEFAAEWDDAMVAGIDSLADEARRRAVEGVQNYVLHMGKPVTRIDPETFEVHEVIKREYSDTLLMMLLKARAPQIYCESVRRAMIEREWKLKEAEAAANANTVPAAALVDMLAEIARQKAALVVEYEAVEAAKKAPGSGNAA